MVGRYERGVEWRNGAVDVFADDSMSMGMGALAWRYQ